MAAEPVLPGAFHVILHGGHVILQLPVLLEIFIALALSQKLLHDPDMFPEIVTVPSDAIGMSHHLIKIKLGLVYIFLYPDIFLFQPSHFYDI